MGSTGGDIKGHTQLLDSSVAVQLLLLQRRRAMWRDAVRDAKEMPIYLSIEARR